MPATRSVDITYVPADCGSILPGKSKAPAAFKAIGIVEKLRAAGSPAVTEHEALDSPATWKAATFKSGSVRNEELNISVCQRVKSAISKNLRTSTPAFQLILGGECCMLPAILSALWQHADSMSPPLRVGLIYIDADTDLASPTDPNSLGTFAGMNMTHLIQGNGSLPSMKQFCRESTGQPVCDESNTVLFGLNMSAPGNKREHLMFLFDNKYEVITSTSVAADPERRATQALKYLEDKVDIIMVHLDVDSIDPGMFPLANVPNFTGVEFDSMMRALRVLLACDKIHGLTVAEVNPDHDPGLDMITRLTDQIVDMVASKNPS